MSNLIRTSAKLAVISSQAQMHVSNASLSLGLPAVMEKLGLLCEAKETYTMWNMRLIDI